MATKKKGDQTVWFQNPPSIMATASIVGPKEGQGPLSSFFDEIIDDELWGEKSWEKAESKMVREVLGKVVNNSNNSMQEVDYIIAGDLLNQCIAANFGLRDSDIPMFGIYGACSTMAEGLSLSAMIVDGGFASNIVCLTSSHFCSAERQFRFPLELGSQRAPTSQWTVTGAGGAMISSQGSGPYITYVTTGKIVDAGINDANNMGGAMAPAAIETISTHFKDTGFSPSDYDLIVTGDLGIVGKGICEDILMNRGYNVSNVYNDCGLMIFDKNKQDTHAGGSGCACSATVLAGYIYKQMVMGNLNRVLFVSTGALLSTTSIQQGETIPCIAHAVTIQKAI